MARKSHHVVKNSKGGWSVKKAGSERASKNFDTKIKAQQYGRNLSKKEGSELVIHGRDGRIQRKDSHGRDPNPPRDRDTHKK